jgi:hypothetical protein
VTLALALALGLAVPARAATTIGQLSPQQTAPTQCDAQTESLQGAEPGGGPSYTVPADGVITRWQTRAGHGAGSAALKVYRPTADPSSFSVVGESSFLALPASAVGGEPTRISVRSGDRIAIRAGDGGGPCDFPAPGYTTLSYSGPDAPPGDTTTFGSSHPGQALDLAAVLEPDADGDGFGDETQDNCPGTAGPLNGCPPPTVGPPVVALSMVVHAARTQHLLDQRGIVLLAEPAVASTITGSATVRVPGKRPLIRFRPQTRRVPANLEVGLRLTLSKKPLARVLKALKARKRLVANVLVTATDASGATTGLRSFIRLKR